MLRLMVMRQLLLVPLVLLLAGCGASVGGNAAELADPCDGATASGFAVSLVSSNGGSAAGTDMARGAVRLALPPMTGPVLLGISMLHNALSTG